MWAAEDLASDDRLFNTIWFRYTRAMKNLRRGEVERAVDDVVKVLDLSFEGYSKTPTERNWKGHRIFVDKASLLLAMQWPSLFFYDTLRYVFAPSRTAEKSYVFGPEKRPNHIFEHFRDNSSWDRAFGKSPWDELLQDRRDRIVADWSDLGPSVEARRHEFSWDIARAIRARNNLFHRGQPLQDEYLLAVLLAAVRAVVVFRVVADADGQSFGDLVRDAENDYLDLLNRRTSQSVKSWVTRGWRSWKWAGP